jgi:hypothetical protein
LSVCAKKAFCKRLAVVKKNHLEVFPMKKMQEFREWLFAQDVSAKTIQHRLGTLTRLNRTQMNSVTEFNPWYIWTSESAK